MTKTKILLVGAAIGAALAVLGVRTYGYTMAIAMPQGFLDQVSVELRLAAWGFLVVNSLGIGVLGAALGFAYGHMRPREAVPLALTTFAGLWLCSRLLIPWYYSLTSSFEFPTILEQLAWRPRWAYDFEVIALTTLVGVAWLTSRSVRN